MSLNQQQYKALFDLAVEYGIDTSGLYGSAESRFCQLCARIIADYGGTVSVTPASVESRKADLLSDLAVTLGATPSLSGTARTRQIQAVKSILEASGVTYTMPNASQEWRLYHLLRLLVLGPAAQDQAVQWLERGSPDGVISLDKLSVLSEPEYYESHCVTFDGTNDTGTCRADQLVSLPTNESWLVSAYIKPTNTGGAMHILSNARSDNAGNSRIYIDLSGFIVLTAETGQYVTSVSVTYGEWQKLEVTSNGLGSVEARIGASADVWAAGTGRVFEFGRIATKNNGPSSVPTYSGSIHSVDINSEAVFFCQEGAGDYLHNEGTQLIDNNCKLSDSANSWGERQDDYARNIHLGYNFIDGIKVPGKVNNALSVLYFGQSNAHGNSLDNSEISWGADLLSGAFGVRVSEWNRSSFSNSRGVNGWAKRYGGDSGFPWETLKDYNIADVAEDSGVYYKCEVPHTSGTFSADLISGYWRELSSYLPDRGTLVTGPELFAGQSLLSDYDFINIAKSVYGGISLNGWQKDFLDPNLATTWVTGFSYGTGNIVSTSISGFLRYFKCKTAHTSGVFAEDLDSGLWEEWMWKSLEYTVSDIEDNSTGGWNRADVIWYGHGESSVAGGSGGNEGVYYYDMMDSIIDDLISTYGHSGTKVVVQGLGFNYSKPGGIYYDAGHGVDAQMKRWADDNPSIAIYVDASDLQTRDGVHYYADGYKTLGERVAPIISSFVGSTVSSELTNLPGYTHNGCESSLLQTDATLLGTPSFWSADGITFDKKTWADFLAHVSATDNLWLKFVKINGVCHLKESYQYDLAYAQTAEDIERNSSYFRDVGCGAGMVARLLTSDLEQVCTADGEAIYITPEVI
jgi:hypothetical protein